MNNRNLAIIFFVLLLIYIGIRVLSGNGDRSFKEELISVDTAKITQILLYPGVENREEVKLDRSQGSWTVTKGDKTFQATEYPVESILRTFAGLKTKRIAAKSPDRWVDYEVTDTSGTRVKAFQGKKTVVDLIVGRFSFNQQARTATSFVRLGGENEVYAVDGFLSMNFNQGFDAFRNKSLVDLNREDLTGLEYSDARGLSRIISKQPQGWMDSNGTPVDSTAMANYLNTLSTLNGTDFFDAFEGKEETPADRTLLLKGNNMLDPVELKCWVVTGEEKPFVIRSSANKEAFFASDSSGVFNRIFGTFESL